MIYRSFKQYWLGSGLRCGTIVCTEIRI